MTIFEYILFGYYSLFIIKYILFIRTFKKWTTIIGKGRPNFKVYFVVSIFGAVYIFVSLLFLLLTERKEFFKHYSDDFLNGIHEAVKQHDNTLSQVVDTKNTKK